MQKKKFDLTSDIVKVDLDIKEEDKDFIEKEQKKINKQKKKVLITIAVEEDFRKEFKSWCANMGLNMNEVFIQGFELLKKNNKK